MEQKFTQAAFWDERFQQQDFAYGQEPNDLLHEQIALFQPGHQVLSLAEGEGRNAVFLAQQGCCVRGVDFSSAGRKRAFQLAQERGVELDYDLADLTRYDMGQQQWDGVIAIFCHLSQEQRPALFESVKRALKPGGIFLLECYNQNQLAYDSGGPKAASHLVSLHELTQAFASFEKLLAQEVERHIHEGEAHHGRSAVTQFIARKRPN